MREGRLGENWLEKVTGGDKPAGVVVAGGDKPPLAWPFPIVLLLDSGAAGKFFVVILGSRLLELSDRVVPLYGRARVPELALFLREKRLKTIW